MTNKVGRNDPCPCGSGKKYKKCHLEQEELDIRPVLNYFARVKAREDFYKSKGIFINYVNPVIFKGGKVWAIGNKVITGRPPTETFHEFIVSYLVNALGEEWWIEQSKLLESEKHFIAKCHDNYKKFVSDIPARGTRISQDKWMVAPDGLTQYLISLAFDICSLEHTLQLPKQLTKRLKNKNEYQGARYEIAIAAIFARLGCNIEFLDDKKNAAIKHCEFIAMHTATNSSVAVEAKSRQREGVLHVPGFIKKHLLRGDVHALINRALKQNPGDCSFMIFVDLNLPLTPDINIRNKDWFKDVEKIMGTYNVPTPETPDPWNGIVFTNFSFHYQNNEESKPSEFLATLSQYPKFPLPSPKFMDMLISALNSYGFVPNIDLVEDAKADYPPLMP